MKIEDVKNIKSKKYNTFINLCEIFNSTEESEMRKALLPSFKAMSGSSTMREFVSKIKNNIDIDIDILEAKIIADKIPDFEMSYEEKHDLYADAITDIAPQDCLFQVVMDKTRSNRVFFIRYGLSLNKTFLSKHFVMSECDYQKMFSNNMIDMLMKVYVYPKTKAFVQSRLASKNVIVEEPKPLKNRNLTTIDILIPFTDKDITERKVRATLNLILDIQNFKDTLFL